MHYKRRANEIYFHPNKQQVLTWIRLSLLPVWVAVAPTLRLVRCRGTTGLNNNNNSINQKLYTTGIPQHLYSSTHLIKLPLCLLWSWRSLVVWSRVVWTHRGTRGTRWSRGSMWSWASMWSRGAMWATHGSDRSLIIQT